jgi:hypothetical protein
VLAIRKEVPLETAARKGLAELPVWQRTKQDINVCMAIINTVGSVIPAIIWTGGV